LFDLSLRIPKDLVDRAQPVIIGSSDILDGVATEKYDGDMYRYVLDRISALVQDGFSSLAPAPNTERNILRIELRSLGSGFWQGSSSTSILKFLHELRGILRYSYAACVMSFPVHQYEEAGVRLPIVRRIEHLCDAVIELESFEGTYASPADIIARQIKGSSGSNQDYHGFLHIHKLPRLNSMTESVGRLSLLHTGGGSSNNLAFRLRRKKFSIETYHLPIEGGVTERRVPAKDDSKLKTGKGTGAGCGSTPGRKDPLEMVFKPLNEREHRFYEGAIDHPMFKPFIPEYYGTLQLNGDTAKVDPPDNQTQKSSTDAYICLENLLYGFENPCIMDVKLGVRLYDVDAPPEKIAKMKIKAKERTVSQIGVMIGGISLPGRPAYEHKWLYKLTTDTIVPDALVPYFSVAEESVGADYRRFVIDQFIVEIKEYREVVKKSETRM
ncbi:Elongator subunit elp4, partial [Coemansia sp. RSA 2703]